MQLKKDSLLITVLASLCQSNYDMKSESAITDGVLVPQNVKLRRLSFRK